MPYSLEPSTRRRKALGRIALLFALIALALTVLPATVVFPALSVGVILMKALLSKIFFSEKLEKRARFALLITIVSLVFINL